MLDSEEKGFNSDTLTSQPFSRLSKRWKKTFTPNIDLTDNHLINHNLINHNLSRISGDSKENSCSSAIIKSESIESDLDDIRPLHSNKEKMESFKNAFKPQCPDFEPSDCPFSCCVFLCLLVKQRRSKKKSSQHGQKDRKNYSSNSIQSNGNTSTIQEDDLIYKSNASNLPTRVSSQTNLNNQRGSNDNLPEQQQAIEQQPGSTNYDDNSINDELRRINKNTQV